MKRRPSSELAALVLLCLMIGTPWLSCRRPYPPWRRRRRRRTARSRSSTEHELPNAPGKSIRVLLVDVWPGRLFARLDGSQSADLRHRVEGAIRSKVNDGPEDDLLQGPDESFSEMPGTATPSAPMRARFLAPANKALRCSSVDTNEKELTTPLGN